MVVDPESTHVFEQQVCFGRWLRTWHRYLSDAAVLATLFLLGLYQTVNLWLSHQPKLLELRNAP